MGFFKAGQEIATFTTQKGNTVLVRLPVTRDVDQLLEFANNLSKENTFVGLSEEAMSRAEEEKYVSGLLTGIEKDTVIQLLAFINNYLVASAGIDRGIRRQTHIGTLHISVQQGYREEGIGQEIMKLLIKCTQEIGLKMILLGCFANNPKALHIYEKLGFKEHGRVPGAFLYKGEYIDEVLMHLKLI